MQSISPNSVDGLSLDNLTSSEAFEGYSQSISNEVTTMEQWDDYSLINDSVATSSQVLNGTGNNDGTALDTVRVKQRSWKKPAGKPKRPLSAYNIFFQLERDRIVSGDADRPFTADDVSKVRIVPTEKKPRRRERVTHGKIAFADLARQIGTKWKILDDTEKQVFEDRAKIEKERYMKDIEIWNQTQNDGSVVPNAKLNTTKEGLPPDELEEYFKNHNSEEEFSPEMEEKKTINTAGALRDIEYVIQLANQSKHEERGTRLHTTSVAWDVGRNGVGGMEGLYDNRNEDDYDVVDDDVQLTSRSNNLQSYARQRPALMPSSKGNNYLTHGEDRIASQNGSLSPITLLDDNRQFQQIDQHQLNENYADDDDDDYDDFSCVNTSAAYSAAVNTFDKAQKELQQMHRRITIDSSASYLDLGTDDDSHHLLGLTPPQHSPLLLHRRMSMPTGQIPKPSLRNSPSAPYHLLSQMRPSNLSSWNTSVPKHRRLSNTGSQLQADRHPPRTSSLPSLTNMQEHNRQVLLNRRLALLRRRQQLQAEQQLQSKTHEKMMRHRRLSLGSMTSRPFWSNRSLPFQDMEYQDQCRGTFDNYKDDQGATNFEQGTSYMGSTRPCFAGPTSRNKVSNVELSSCDQNFHRSTLQQEQHTSPERNASTLWSIEPTTSSAADDVQDSITNTSSQLDPHFGLNSPVSGNYIDEYDENMQAALYYEYS